MIRLVLISALCRLSLCAYSSHYAPNKFYGYPAVNAVPAFGLQLAQPRGSALFPGDPGVPSNRPGSISRSPGVGIGGGPQGGDGSVFVPAQQVVITPGSSHDPSYPPRPASPGGSPSSEGGGADGAYDFEYKVEDPNGSHSRKETRDKDGRVTGYYIIALADGRQRVVEYTADEFGFRAKVDTNEPGTQSNESPADVEWSSTADGSIPTSQGGQTFPTGVGQPPAPHPVIVVDDSISTDGRGQTQKGSQVPPNHRTPFENSIIQLAPARRTHLAPPRPINEPWNRRGTNALLLTAHQRPIVSYHASTPQVSYSTPFHRYSYPTYVAASAPWKKA